MEQNFQVAWTQVTEQGKIFEEKMALHCIIIEK